MKPEHQGEAFADFLDGPGIREDVENQAIKAILADQICAAMAARMQTSRRALDRLLDPENESLTLHTREPRHVREILNE